MKKFLAVGCALVAASAAFAGDPHAETERRAIAKAVGDPARFEQAVERGLKSADPLVRRFALNELVMRDPARAVAKARELTGDPAEEVQLFLLDVSSLVKDEKERAAFVKAVAAKSRYPEVQTAAERRLGFPFFRNNVAPSKDPENDHDMTPMKKIELPKCGWKFTTDDARSGHRRDVPYFAPSFDDAAWKPIEIGRVWEEQGFGGYDGVGWYRLTFRLPAKPAAAKALELCFGAVDEDAWVWLNGKYVGQHAEGPSGYAVPFRFGVDAEANWGGENQITVRVGDSGNAGGIWKGITLEIMK